MSGLRFNRLRVLGVALVAWLLVPTALASAQGADATINMGAQTFDQTEVHVAPGQTVVWRDPDVRTHTVTADDGSFDSGDVTPGKQFAMEFDTPGTYPYYCQYHGGPGGDGMSGILVVDG
jgi:plastocyanin